MISLRPGAGRRHLVDQLCAQVWPGDYERYELVWGLILKAPIHRPFLDAFDAVPLVASARGFRSAYESSRSLSAAFDLVGKQLSPWIRDLGKITLYRTGPPQEFLTRYPRSGPLLTRRLNTDLVTGMWDDLLRVAAV